MVIGVMAREANNITSTIWRVLTIIFCFGMFIYVTKESIKSTFIIRKMILSFCKWRGKD